jgi:CPA1 family monovalent cation:H+ antiporter
MLNSLVFLKTGESDVIQIEIAVILSLVLITGISLLVRKLRFPYTVTLVLVGLLLAFISNMLPGSLNNLSQFISSELILAIFVPPLIFEGALHIQWKLFRENLLTILLMAIVGVLAGAFMVGGLVIFIFEGMETAAASLNLVNLASLPGIPLTAAIAFGALISATDPVAVIAFFRTLGVNKRLSVLVEGESLLNDGTSIVIFKIALALGGAAVVAHGQEAAVNFSFINSFWEFSKVSIGGVLVGLIIGKLGEFLFARTDHRLVETTLTMPAAFGAYLLAEQLHLSGILSVVAAGIYMGNAIPAHTSPTTKIALYNFWEVLSFIFTSMIFLLIGWVIDIRQFFTPRNLLLIIAAVIAILVSRLVVVYFMSFLSNHGIPAVSKWVGKPYETPKIPVPYQHVMFWGGLRGAISLALAISLAPNVFGVGMGEQLRLMTFGVVLFTLVVQGTTIEKLIRKLGLARKSKQQYEKERYLGRYFIVRAAQEELTRLHRLGIFSGSVWEAVREAQQAELEQYDQAVRDMLHRHPGVGHELAIQARQIALQAQRTAIGDAMRQGIISDEILEELTEELDAKIEVIELIAQQAEADATIQMATSGDQEDE